jgi:geranylgeranyl diphosphate synthase type I
LSTVPPAALDRFTADVAAEIGRVLEGHALPLYDMVRYHLGWIGTDGRPTEGASGKGLRSTLCLLACEAAGGPTERALPAAAALELVHNFSLVHDDIQDDSPTRRHRPTVWARWGKPQAINAGDALFALARLSLLRLQETGVPATQVVDLSRLLDETCLRLCEGQYEDMAFELRAEVSVAGYIAMIASKTAALMATACRLGAAVATPGASAVDHFAAAGYNLGLAFQVRDDVLGVWGASDATGKPVAEDILSRKKAFPAVHALNHATGRRLADLRSIYDDRAPGPDDVERVLAIFDATGARAAADAAASAFGAAAIAALDATGRSGPAMESLRALVHFSVAREF